MTQPVAVTAVVETFAYRAQDREGLAINGTIDAENLDAATRQLNGLGLRIVSIAAAHPSAPPRPLNGTDFLAFNEQLAQITAAGLPVEHGLKLIAQDLRGGRLAATVKTIADELDRGTSLSDALALHQKQFPPLYARLVEAGVRSGNLSGLLMNLGTHLEMIRRLRASLWRACSYPLMVLAALGIVLLFLHQIVFPQFRSLYGEFFLERVRYDLGFVQYEMINGTRQVIPPLPMRLVFLFADSIPYIVVGAFSLIVLFPLALKLLDRSGNLFERLIFRVPLIGPILRHSLLARWCDAARLGVNAGLDLPAALRLAGDAVASPALTEAGSMIASHLERGESLAMLPRLRLLPATIPAAIELSSAHNNLPETLGTLAQMYRRQAQSRLDNLPTVLTPLLLLLIAVLIGLTIGGLMYPLFAFLQQMSSRQL